MRSNKNDRLGLFPDRFVEEVQLRYIAGVRYHLDYLSGASLTLKTSLTFESNNLT